MVLKDYIVLDIETTGLSRFYHNIIEICAIKYKNHKEVDRFETLVNPECHIPSFIHNLTGINDKMVKDAPLIQDVIYDLYKFLENYIIIGHNISFDYNFIEYNLQKHFNLTLKNKKLCTLKLSRRVIKNVDAYTLTNLCKELRITNDNAHRASSDVMATKELFLIINDIVKENNYLYLKDLFNIEKMRIGEFSYNSYN
ncbi:MAG: 3'-5' exonuclease [Candidatus Nanoarchaeia archaeon]|nr:3'-5' exonuclease [Candidatus Nanoarchaeia archaeon]